MTAEQKNSTSNHMWIWFGAAISIAEIMTGMLFAPLGLVDGVGAIVIGHIIGLIFLYFIGLMGAETGMTAMNTVGISFGSEGKKFFAALNVCQLVGWTAVMIVNGAGAIRLLMPYAAGEGDLLGSVIVGGLVLIWSVVTLRLRSLLNTLAVIALTVLCAVVTYHLSAQPFVGGTVNDGTISFGNAIELALIMPLSWLPLVADYTREAKHPFKANLAGVTAYTAGSIWMYTLGLGAALYTSFADVPTFLYEMGLGLAAALVIIFSTVTTTYLDVRSAAISFLAISDSVKERTLAAVVAIIGIVMAVTVPVSYYEEFLYFIGSCFAPMTAILLADYYLVKERTGVNGFDKVSLLLWGVGFILYRYLLSIEPSIGVSLPVILIVMVLTVMARRIK